jgi:serine/threonine-protein kinase
VDTDRNLLFGVLALQADLLDNDRFAEACSAWATRKEMPLADLLVERGWLTAQDRADVEQLLARKLKKHGGDAHAGLAEVTTDPVRRTLAGVADPDVQQALAGPTPPAAGPALPATTAYVPEARGRYTLTRLHATGGIGRVWLARDASLGRDVALKELRPERAGHATLRARFLKEAQVTGQLEHPGIVPIYEVGGRPGDNQPFYTMRFVRGRTLAEAVAAYHRRRARGQAAPLELRELLTAFVDVCNAVAFAHSRGVLHRDLKPHNVVLGDYGEVVVLDWGLAKTVGQPEADGADPLTVSAPGEAQATLQGEVLGTAGYMAPEQAEGRLDLLGPATDVYGLGAILYEILTGQSPFAGGLTQEVLRRVAREEPLRPRQRVPATPRALEAICLKALAKQPAQRYASAADLARDLRHYLADEPVSAHPEGRLVRLGRWGRRHKPLVWSAVALLLAAVVALSAGTLLLGRANARTEEQRQLAGRQRDLAEANFHRARQVVDDYLTQVGEHYLLKSQLPGLQPLRKELLSTALKYYQGFVEQHTDDPNLQAELARAYYRVGTITKDVGTGEDALRALARSRDLWGRLAEQSPEDPDDLLEQARACQAVGSLQSELTGHFEQALQPLEQSRALCEQLVARDPSRADYQEALARSDFYLGKWYAHHDIEEAMSYYAKSRAILERLVASDPKFRASLASSYMAVGYLYTTSRKVRQALEAHEKAAGLLEALARENPADTQASSQLSRVYLNIGYAHHVGTRDYPRALQYYEKAQRIREQLRHENPQVTAFQTDAAAMHVMKANVFQSTGRIDDAIGAAREATDILEKVVVAADPLATQQLQTLLNTYLLLADLYQSRRQAADSMLAQEKARKLLDQMLRESPDGMRHPEMVGTCLCQLAEAQVNTGQTAEAMKTFAQSVQILQKHFARNPTDMQTGISLTAGHTGMAKLRAKAGQAAAARESLRQAQELLEKYMPNQPRGLFVLARTYCQMGLLVGDGKHSALTAEEQAERVRLEDRAMDALRRAVAAGYRGLADLRGDTDLDPLRRRDDFRKLLKDMEAKGP